MAERFEERFSVVAEISGVRRTITCGLLERYGFKVAEASNQHEVFAICRSRMPTVILFDDQTLLGPLDEFIHTIRSLREGDKPVIIMKTGNSNSTIVARLMQGGLSGAMNYVFDAEILRRKLQQTGAL